jgi:hypothetical protein
VVAWGPYIEKRLKGLRAIGSELENEPKNDAENATRFRGGKPT